MIKKIFLTPIDSGYVVMFLRTIALAFVVGLIFFIPINWERNQYLIAPLGILISALLASFSVVLSIDTNIKLKKIEISNKIRNVFFHLCRIKMRLICLVQEKEKQKISYYDLDRISETIKDINNMLSAINSSDIVSITHNDVLTDLHFLYLKLNTYNTAAKTFFLNINRPEDKTYYNNAILPNPLNTVSFKFEDAVDKLSKILVYLKDGYEKDFPSNGGIEKCAEYKPPVQRN